MLDPIVGINRSSLWRAWKAVRTELRNASVRDIVDYLDFDVDPECWIRRTLREISAGTYEPRAPHRFSLAKSSGFSRTMSLPTIPDLIVYRAAVDFIYDRARHAQQPHVYFLRSQIHQAERTAGIDAATALQAREANYRSATRRSFINWLHFDQYRKLLILDKIHPFIVITDITNFFDSVLHAHVAAALRAFKLPPRMVGLLFLLLERLAVRHDFSDSLRIGLAVDEFDCSRTIAHVVLFDHDKDMVRVAGQGNYVRWMDDQNLGVRSRAAGLRVLAAVGRSLARFHLTPNAKKSRILSLREARRHFHFDINHGLDAIEQITATGALTRRGLVRRLSALWRRARRHEGRGEWEKILKRFYRLAGFLRARFLRGRTLRDILATPSLAERIFDYMRCSGNAGEYIHFVDRISENPQQVYPDVNLFGLEGLLRVEPSAKESPRLLARAREILKLKRKANVPPEAAGTAALMILRFGDRRSLRSLATCFGNERNRIRPEVVRSTAIAYASYGRQQFFYVRRTAARLLWNPLAEMVQLVERILKFEEPPPRFKARLSLRYDAVAGRKFVDMRTIVTARLLALNKQPRVRKWLRQWRSQSIGSGVSRFDKKLLMKRLTL